MAKCEFYFRVWLWPAPLEVSPPELEVFYPDFEVTREYARRCDEWFREAMEIYNWEEQREALKLDPEKYYQLVGRAYVEPLQDPLDGEYDECFDVLECKAREETQAYFELHFGP